MSLRRAHSGDDERPARPLYELPARPLHSGGEQAGVNEDEDPFGYAHLGLDDAAGTEPIAASAVVAAEATVGEARGGEEAPSTGPTRAARRLEALQLRVRARERAAAMRGPGAATEIEPPDSAGEPLTLAVRRAIALQHEVGRWRPEPTSS